MLQFLEQIPFSLLLILAVFMLLAPFHPMPHVVEKIIMLKNGELKRPLDIFDLCFHLTPLVLLGLKWWLTGGRS
ncbi:hypothetical protein ACUUL3_02625 [Thiovibrio sp. JS02]